MKLVKALLLISLCLCVIDSSAQKRKTTAKAKPKAVVVEEKMPTPEELLYENMLSSTQQVMIIDSIVVDKEQFINYIPLPSECGSLMYYDAFFGTSGHSDSYVWLNEFKNRAYYSVADAAGKAEIGTIDKLGTNWTKGKRLEGISYANPLNYPYLMADGITLYFGQKGGNNSLGGYDIYVTRYDAESGTYFRPENIGLPFNSPANDYMYLEDETDNIGWFVTDRRQPEGKVCIYTFIPNKTRQNYDLSEYNEAQVKRFAAIESISDTWTDNQKREEALQRLVQMREQLQQASNEDNIHFVINDNITYRQVSQFKSPSAKKLFLTLIQTQERFTVDSERLESLRDQYAGGSEVTRARLTPTILDLEKTLEQTEQDIKDMEKQIRNAENMTINQ